MDKSKVTDSLKLVVKTASMVLIGIVVSKIFTYLYKVIIARYYGAEIYGLFSLSLAIIGLVIAIASLGLTEGVLRFIPYYRSKGKKNVDKIKYIFKFSYSVSLISSVLFGVILFLISDFIAGTIFHSTKLAIFLKIFSVLVPITTIAGIFLSVLRGFELVNAHTFVFNIFQNILKLSLILIFIFLAFPDINAVAFSYIISILGMLILAHIICYLKTPEIFLKASIKKKEKNLLIKEIVAYSWPMMFFTIGYNIFYWIDTLSIGFFKSSIEVGWYNAAIPIALLFYIAPELFMQLFFPLIVREYSNKKGKNLKVIKELSKQISKWIFIINLPFFILVFLFPGTIINILFGKEYLVAENVLKILSIGVFFVSITRISQHLILMIGKSKVVLYNIIIASIINFILNVILIQKYGINGAAFATTTSTIFLGLLFLFQANYYTSILPFKRKMFTIFIASLIPTLILLYLRKILEINITTIIFIAIIFLSIYASLIFIFRGFDSNDMEILKSVKRKVINTKNRITHQNYDFS